MTIAAYKGWNVVRTFPQALPSWDLEILSFAGMSFKGTLLGTPNREPQEYSRNVMEYEDSGRYIPIILLPTIFLEFPLWGSQ